MERAGLIGGVGIKMVATDEHFSVRAETLEKMVAEDKAAGFIPFFVGERAHSVTHPCTHTTHARIVVFFNAVLYH